MHSISFFQALQMTVTPLSSFIFFFAFAFVLLLIINLVRTSDAPPFMGVFAFLGLLLLFACASCIPAHISSVLSNPDSKILSVTKSAGDVSVVIGYGGVNEVSREKVLGQDVDVRNVEGARTCVLDKDMLGYLTRMGYTIANVPIAEAVKVARAK